MVMQRLRSVISRLLSDPAYRGLLRARLSARGIHQTTIFTGHDRYPEIFAECVRLLGARGDGARLLSFGCSTGEETTTLRRYFPTARIFGTDINTHNLQICRRLPSDLSLTFFRSKPSKIRQYGPYDAIFCMAVLQRTPHLIRERDIRDLTTIYPFARFEQQLVALDRSLRPGGLLVIEHTHYRLADTILAQSYAPALFRPNLPSSVAKFDRYSKRIEDEAQPVIFVKLGRS